MKIPRGLSASRLFFTEGNPTLDRLDDHGRGVFVTVPVVRRVGVRVALPLGMRVPVMGKVLVSSTVGVWVNSRVGIGACVGVGSRVPPGKLMNVGGGFVAVGSNAVRVMTVGVGAC
jgi:hypothetical protein